MLQTPETPSFLCGTHTLPRQHTYYSNVAPNAKASLPPNMGIT